MPTPPTVWDESYNIVSVDHSTKMVDRLLTQFQRCPNFLRLLAPIAEQAQQLEAAFYQLIVNTSLDNATGAQLDIIGWIIKRPRRGLPDSEYRAILRVEILVHKSSGTFDDIYEIFGVLFPDDPMQITDLALGSLILYLDRALDPVDDPTPVELARLLDRARAAGITSHFHHGLYASSSAFTLAVDDTIVTDNTFGLSNDAGTIGGYLTQVTA